MGKSKHRPKAGEPSELEKLLDQFKIKDWTYLVVGDGSGTTWEREIGWGVHITEAATLASTELFGAFNRGTNNIAEIMAYFHALLWISEHRKNKGEPCRVHIITDSQFVANSGNNPQSSGIGSKNSYREIWAFFKLLRRRGILIQWHWCGRDILAHNIWAHNWANRARKKLLELKPAKQEEGS